MPRPLTLTEDELSEIFANRLDPRRKSAPVIAEEMNVDTDVIYAVWNYFHKLTADQLKEVVSHKPPATRRTAKDLAGSFGISQQAVINLWRRNRTLGDDPANYFLTRLPYLGRIRARELYRAGKTIVEIGKELGALQSAVEDAITEG